MSASSRSARIALLCLALVTTERVVELAPECTTSAYTVQYTPKSTLRLAK